MNDMEILRRAYEREHDTRDRRPPQHRSWEYYTIGASRNDIKRLLDEGLLIVAVKTAVLTKYKLSEKGRSLVWATSMEREFAKIPATSVLEAMDLVVGFDDLKDAIARAVEARRRINFLLEGPPACAKSIMLEGVRSAVPDAYIAFGSRTSAAGLSDALFEFQPSVLLLDEADKMDNDCYSVLLGLMESGEVLETKSRRSRGIKLDTMVIAACNSSAKMPPEFLSRFALHAHFPKYSREEFIEVCTGFLTRAESCPPDLASLIGQLVYDYGIGDVRKARGAWQLMIAPTDEEVRRVVQLMLKYSPNGHKRTRSTQGSRLPGI
ncbi:hypothetical protein ES707_00161 [subsurface metagenome]